MQNLRNAILSYMRIPVPGRVRSITENLNGISRHVLPLRACSTTSVNQDQVMDQVLKLVKNFVKTDAAKVTETADFQKDLSLDSLDRTELVMAFEEEFSVEIPDEEADKLKCCADVAKYVMSSSAGKDSESS